MSVVVVWVGVGFAAVMVGYLTWQAVDVGRVALRVWRERRVS